MRGQTHLSCPVDCPSAQLMMFLVRLLLATIGFLSVCVSTTAAATVADHGVDKDDGLLVIGAGMGRTGTDSLRLALNALGFGPTYHMHELLGTSDTLARNLSVLEFLGLGAGHNEQWVEADRNISLDRPVDWNFLYEHYNSAVDQPANCFWPQLLADNPTAKVILTVRESTSWYRSINGAWCRLTGGGSYMDRILGVINGIRPYGIRRNRFHRATERAIGRVVGLHDFSYQRICKDETYAISFFDAWNNKAKDVVPSKQLLVFETGKDGYNELATFLGVPVPNGVSYPRVNSAEEFAFVIRLLRTLAVLTVLVPCLSVWVISRYCTRRRGRTGTRTSSTKQKLG